MDSKIQPVTRKSPVKQRQAVAIKAGDMDSEIQPVTSKPPVKQRPAVAIKAGDITKAMQNRHLSPERKRWCEIVTANNPPGQELFVDPSLIAELNGEAQSTDTEPDENV